MGKKIFVTVGTTKFPKLVQTITTEKVLLNIVSQGYDFVQIQTGKDFNEIPDISLPYKIVKEHNSTLLEFTNNKLIIKYDPYFENFNEEILKSDLVISHAGAGTCLEVLRHRKPLLVVVNEELMDNHQIELAEELENNGYLYFSTCDTLGDVLNKDFSMLKSYPEQDKLVFSDYLNKSMGFV